jgi:hypothetical protein
VTARNAEVDGDEPYDNDYDELHRDTADSGGPPWDIGGPQPALAEVLDDGVKGPKVLDVGCGTGDPPPPPGPAPCTSTPASASMA